MTTRKSLWLPLALGVTLSGMTHATDHLAPTSNDPNLWLENIDGTRQLDWVKQQNAQTVKKYADSAEFKQLDARILEVLDSNERIPMVSKIGDHFYNFWRDKDHPKGLWRRTTLDEYRNDQPAWETVIDLDALAKAENENWVWHGVQCLKPEYQRCLISLSRGGADADVVREFDLPGKQFVKDGFALPEAKTNVAWKDKDHLYVATDFGAGSMTTSSYPRIVKEWRRGTPLSSATTVYEAKNDDMTVSAIRDNTPGFERDFVSRQIAFYDSETFLRGKDGKLTRIDVPDDANTDVHRQWLLIEPRRDWTVGGKAYKAGVKIAFGTDAAVYPHGQNAREFEYMVQAGMPPMFVLQAATTHAAELLHKQDELGQIAVGRHADVIAVPGNPLDDITLMQKVSFVMKDGVVYKQDGKELL